MNIGLTYLIANHAITFTMGSSNMCWKYMDNYHPFLIKEKVGDIVCDITVVESLSVALDNFSPVLINDFNPDAILVFEIYKNAQSDYLIKFKYANDGNINSLLLLEHGFSKATIQLAGPERIKHLALNRAIMLAYILSTGDKDTLLMHSSTVINSGRAYMFLGKSGTGKSTHASLWCRHIPGSELLNDDNPIIRLIDGKAIVYGSPWSGKTPCYRNVSSPIGGIVRIKQSKENRARRLNIIESYASLVSSGSGMSWEKSISDGKHQVLQHITQMVPCWLMECLPNEDAANECYQHVTEA